VYKRHVVIIAIIPIILGLPLAISILVGGGCTLVVPLLLGGQIVKGWNAETHQIAEAHPFLFLRKVRDIKRSGYYLELASILAAIAIVATRNELMSLFSSNTLILALFEFWPIELVFLQTLFSFWAPTPFEGLRASLRSEFDVEKLPERSWLDDSISYFNRLSAKNIGFTLSTNLSLDLLLYGSQSRILRITMLLSDLYLDHLEYLGFIADISEIAQKPIAEILEKNAGFLAFIKKNQASVLSILGLAVTSLIALSPFIVQYFLNPLISEWSQLLH